MLWAARKALSPALRKLAPNKLNEDVVVPVSRIPELIDGLDQLSKRSVRHAHDQHRNKRAHSARYACWLCGADQ